MYKLRDYQQDAVDACIDYINNKKEKRPGMVVAPTAAGKSWIIAEVAKRYGKKVLVIQPSVELLEQNYDKLRQIGEDASLYAASVNSKEVGHITYSILPSIKKKARLFKEEGVDLVIIDECHYKIDPKAGSMFDKFIKALNPKKVIGLTATAFRLKTNSEGSRLVLLNRMRPGYFRHFIHVTQIQDMIDRNYWSKSIDEKWDMEEGHLVLNTSGSEFTDSSIKKTIEANGINNNIFLRVRELQKEGKYKSILVFVDCLESAEKFSEHVSNSVCVHGNMKPKERKSAIEGFKSGDIQVVFNYGVLTTGFDHPELDCIIMGRPTNSLAMFYQIYGRGVRIHENKDHFLFIDCCKNFDRLGHPRDLSLIEFPGHGWCIFEGDRLVTGVYLDSTPITKQDLLNKNEEVDMDMTMPFGKHKDLKVSFVCKKYPSYIDFLLRQDWVKPVFRKKVTEIHKKIQIEGSEVKKEITKVFTKLDDRKSYSGPLPKNN